MIVDQEKHMKIKNLLAFSVVAFMLAFTVAPAMAMEHQTDHQGSPGDDDMVYNLNEAVVVNDIITKANTGMNFADGSYGGDGGDAGDIRLNSHDIYPNGGALVLDAQVEGFDCDYVDGDTDNEVEESSTGHGGAGGNAGTGGTVITGNATAISTVSNDINNNDTEVDRCACDEDEALDEDSIKELAENAPFYFWADDDVRIKNRNRVELVNTLYTKANSGMNDTMGSYGGYGGEGGEIALLEGDENDVDESHTGSGGLGGNSGEGGLIQSGEAYSDSAVMNTLNRNLTRIRR